MPRSKKFAAAAAAAPEAVTQTEPVEAVEASPNDTADTAAQSSASTFGKQESSGRIRGPVEEVIAKRVRTLGKKIQRFRVYAAQPIEKLNADQKAAIASLPILEAQSRELEDLIKSGGAVEVAELGESAKLRGLKEEVEAKARSDAESASSSYHTNLATPLSGFLNLYTLLHPARSADHEHLTFSPLDLPSQLQDEVQATDVLRVGKMWEELLGGGEKAGEVLAGLSKGPTGEDEEDDHIHHLIKLLIQPSTNAESSEDAPAAEEESPETFAEPTSAAEETREVIDVEPTSTIEESTATLPNGDHAPAETKKSGGGGALNFLQDDELDAGAVASDEAQEPEEGFEIVEPAAPHETEHYEVPTPTAPTPAEESTSTPAAVPETSTAKPAFDWADEHDEPSPATETPKVDAEASAPAAETTAEAPESSTAPAAGASRGGRGGRGRGGPRRGGGGNRSNANGGQSPSGQNQTETGQATLPIPPKPVARQQSKAGVVVDEDGFEMKVKPSARGRGGGGGGAGRGGRGGGSGQREGGEYRGGGRGRGEGRGGRGGSRGGAGGEGQQRPPRPSNPSTPAQV